MYCRSTLQYTAQPCYKTLGPSSKDMYRSTFEPMNVLRTVGISSSTFIVVCSVPARIKKFPKAQKLSGNSVPTTRKVARTRLSVPVANCISEAPDTLQQRSQFAAWYYIFCPTQSAEFKVYATSS